MLLSYSLLYLVLARTALATCDRTCPSSPFNLSVQLTLPYSP
jgi:hypothetical protein